MIPPVPAPRYKRKMITSEDSTNTCIKQKTCETDQSVDIRPPPRRKDKFQNNEETNNISPLSLKINKQNGDIIEKGDKLNNTYTLEGINNLKDNKNSSSLFNENVVESTHLFTSERLQEKLKTNVNNGSGCEKEFKRNKEKFFQVVATSPISKDCKSISSILQYQNSNIIENISEDSVLDIPLEIDKISIDRSPCIENCSLCLNTCKDLEYKRANDPWEKPATIVGVFYKPEYCSLNVENKENHILADSTLINKDEICSTVSDEIKNTTSKPIINLNKGNKIHIKDSEENDSGVYFSDSKSPPHKWSHTGVAKNVEVQESKSSNLEDNCQFYKSVLCNASDTIDNKSSEDLGPPSYERMLDYFEAQTVRIFHKEISSQISLFSREFQTENTVGEGLNSEDCLSKQKDDSFSKYLRSMLEMSDGPESLSPNPLSVVEEDDLNSVSGEAEIMEEKNDRNPIREACCYQSSLTICNDYSKLDDSNNVDRNVDLNIVHNITVNNHSDRVTQNKIKNITNTINYDNKDQETGSIGVFSIKASNNVSTKGCTTPDTSDGNNYLDIAYTSSEIEQNKNIDSQFVPSPSIKHGAVISLIAYFENIKKHENEDYNKDFDEDLEMLYEFQEEFETNSMSQTNEEGVIENEFSDKSNNTVLESNQEKLKTNSIQISHNPLEEEKELIAENAEKFESNDTVVDCVETQKRQIDNAYAIDESFNILDSSPSTNKENTFLFHNDFITKDSTDFSTNNKYGTYQGGYKEMIQNCSFETFDNSFAILETIQSTYTRQVTDENYFKEISKEIASDNHLTSCQPETETSNSVINTNNSNMLHLKSANLFEISTLDENDITSSEGQRNCFVETDETVGNNENVQLTYEKSGVIASCKTGITVSKPTRIPIVILNDDIGSNQIGSLELHPSDNDAGDIERIGSNVKEVNNILMDNGDCQINETVLNDSITVELEKNWGSVGLKIRGMEQGVIISEVLAGGVAEESGQIFKGFVDIKAMAEEKEIFC